MIHYLKSKDGNFNFKVEMGCNHPDLKGNSSENIGCDGQCEKCGYSIATMTIPVVAELIKRAHCNYR